MEEYPNEIYHNNKNDIKAQQSKIKKELIENRASQQIKSFTAQHKQAFGHYTIGAKLLCVCLRIHVIVKRPNLKLMFAMGTIKEIKLIKKITKSDNKFASDITRFIDNFIQL